MRMNVFVLVCNYLKAKALNTLINMLLLALGISMITSILLFNHHLGERAQANMRNIDLVVGAKGSPLQLILCNIFHLDFPTGNIKLRDVEPIVKHPLVKAAIPLSLGDSYEGYRIVGTTKEYAALYHAELTEGTWFNREMQAVIGASVATSGNLELGSEFNSAHGLSDALHEHEEKFKVTGVLEKTNTVLDDLILTSLESVWEAHETHSEEEEHSQEDEHIVSNPYTLAPSIDRNDTTTAITSALIQFKNPMGAIQLPRYINADTPLQAASPAFEATRLFSILGVGLDVLRAFAIMIVFIAGLSIFIALYNSLRERQYDLAIMRTLGASRVRLFFTIALEGCSLTFFGAMVGIILGHASLSLLSMTLDVTTNFNVWQVQPEELYLMISALLFGFLCSVIPAMLAYRTNIHKVLVGG